MLQNAETTGYSFKPNKLLDQGVPGRYHASHAEPQMTALAPDEPFAVSREMCDGCMNYMQHVAETSGKPQVVADPTGVRIFHPNGETKMLGGAEAPAQQPTQLSFPTSDDATKQ